MSKVLAPEALALVVRSINDLAEAGKWEDVPALINGILASHNQLHAETARLREALEMIAQQKFPADDPELHTDDMNNPHALVPVQFARLCWTWDTARRALEGEDVTTDD